MLDIDYFKQYNDCYGHVHGDACLKQVAQLLSSKATRARDLFARFGGEKFVIVLAETDEVAARKVAERCQSLNQKAQISHANSAISSYLTVRMGVNSVLRTQHEGMMAFIEATYQSLYHAKQSGRNLIF